MSPAFLAELVSDFARAIEVIDPRAPVATNSRSGAHYQPGIGPHTETRTVEVVITNLATTDPPRYGSCRLGATYGDGTRQACDLCLSNPTAGDWRSKSRCFGSGRQRQTQRQHDHAHLVALPRPPQRPD